MIASLDLCAALEASVREAGAAILAIKAEGIDVTRKGDGSPVTQADRVAEDILCAALAAVAPDIPVVSEENPKSHSRSATDAFFLVDALDGTREFIRADTRGAYTVNIGLIEQGSPTLGLLFAPARGRFFHGVMGSGAYENGEAISVRSAPSSGGVAFASRSHHDARTDALLAQMGVRKTRRLGSSLKFGLLACGEADIYARHSPTMEWDIAAGDAILRAAGGMTSSMDGKPYTYGKKRYRNGPFIAQGRVSSAD